MPLSESTVSRKPIRILEVVDTLDAGGMEKQLVALMNKLGEGGFEFEVCCLRHPGVHASSLDPAHTVHSIGKPEGFRLDVALKLHGLIRRGFDLVHTHNMGSLIYASIATLGGTLCPIFHGEHAQFTPSDAKPGKFFQRQWLYRSCRAIHTVSSQQCDELRAMHIKHPAMFPLINGVNIKNFRPAADASEKAALRSAHGVPWPDGKVLGIVGRFGSFKRHLELIEAFEQIAEAHPDWRLVAVGDGGPNKSRVLEKMRTSAFASRMFWSGHQQDVAPFVRMLDLLVVASSNEGLSNVTLEALASGVPVLSNTVCGADELIQHGQGGWVKDLSTVSRLAEALRDCISLSTSELYSVGVRGRLRAEALFSWDAMAQRYADCFRRLAHRA